MCMCTWRSEGIAVATREQDQRMQGSGRKHLAALVLCKDHLVRAYASVDEARAARPRIILEQPFEVKESGAKAAPQDDCYALLREPVAVPTLPAVSSSLQGRLLRTNVQKAVRRQDAAAAAASVAQYFAHEAQGVGRNDYQKTLLERLPIIAAEDATTVPLALALQKP